MCACLLLLTGANFFVYNQSKQEVKIQQASKAGSQNERSAEKPSEQKTSSTNLSIQEEYVHDQHSLHAFPAVYHSSKYHLVDDAKLAIVHFELISPPPDLQVS